MSGAREKPRNRKAAPEKAPAACGHCRAPFDAATWPRSKWTLSGWSPFCPVHHKQHAGVMPWKKKPGPKPKGRATGWPNLPH